MSIKGVKFIIRVASCLAIFDRKARETAPDTKVAPVADPELPAVPAERLSLRFYPDGRMTRGAAALGIA